MKKPKIRIDGEIIIGVKPEKGEFKREILCNEELSTELINDMIDDIMCMYYHFLGQWESVKDHPSSNYGRDAFSLYETLVNAGCEPEKEETERFRKAGYIE